MSQNRTKGAFAKPCDLIPLLYQTEHGKEPKVYLSVIHISSALPTLLLTIKERDQY